MEEKKEEKTGLDEVMEVISALENEPKDWEVEKSVDTPCKWDEVLKRISKAKDGTVENPRTWVVEIAGDFSVDASLVPKITGAYKIVRLIGTGTISLEDNDHHGSILWVEAEQTFIINGPTLQGNMDNTAPVVYIKGGTVELEKGTICKNLGGGVEVNSGVFMMSGDSTIYNTGVGVSVGDRFEVSDSGQAKDSRFKMNGGTIRGYHANTGCGVRVGPKGKFIMICGAIRNNHVVGIGGGGVYVEGGMFTMEGGTIHNNGTDGIGGINGGGRMPVNDSGGVSVSDSGNVSARDNPVPKKVGTMSENIATDDAMSNRFASNGGGVFVNGGTFEMSGDSTISGNYANDNGGGVYVGGNGRFTMNGGTIYGKYKPAEDGVVLKNTAQNGAALCANGGTITPHTLVTTNDTIKDRKIQKETTPN